MKLKPFKPRSDRQNASDVRKRSDYFLPSISVKNLSSICIFPTVHLCIQYQIISLTIHQITGLCLDKSLWSQWHGCSQLVPLNSFMKFMKLVIFLFSRIKGLLLCLHPEIFFLFVMILLFSQFSPIRRLFPPINMGHERRQIAWFGNWLIIIELMANAHYRFIDKWKTLKHHDFSSW